jgi:type I restriction enzyme R subunit
VPPRAVSLNSDFMDRGIDYDRLPEDEKEAWDAIEWDEEGAVPARVEPAAVNKWLFNKDTVEKVLEHLMREGLKVAGGDRLGKTIVFAKNHDHAQFIAERFDANYPHLRGSFARVIDFKTEYAQSLIDDFSQSHKPPHIAVSVDMLDTGIDVPEVLNLVFFKVVRSKTKFWQMLGRGTRLCPDLFGPGRHKEFFTVFDWCRNFEFFNQNPELVDAAAGEPLGMRLFKARVELVGALDGADAEAPEPEKPGDYPQVSSRHLSLGEPDSKADLEAQHRALRETLVEQLRDEIAGMSLDNFIVRPKRRFVEKYQAPEPWLTLGPTERAELTEELAGLPSDRVDEDMPAKQFDLLILMTQLALLRTDKEFAGLRKRVTQIAGLLEELSNVPMVAKEMTLILDLQTEEFWQDITLPMLETVRRRLRDLVKLIELKKRPIVYTDFEDSVGSGTPVDIAGIQVGTDLDRFRMKARFFLKDYENHIAVLKLRRNEPLTAMDLQSLEQVLIDAGVAGPQVLEQIRAEGGLGLFIRSLVGLEREAAKRAFADFLDAHRLNADQIEFLNMIIDHLTERGAMDPRLLYENPFTDLDPLGAAGLFQDAEIVELVGILAVVRQRAAA